VDGRSVQSVPVAVDDDQMVVLLAGVDADPCVLDVLHPASLVDVRVAADVLAVRSLRSDRCRRSQSAVKTS
jgi:hypothetical protein